MNKFVIGVLFSLITSSAFASYPLICRGGGNIKVNTLASFYPTPGGVALQPHVDIFFAKGALPSGQQGEGLNPGECSWLDRAINNAEPAVVTDQYLTGQSVTVLSQASATGTKTVDVTSVYSPLANPTDGSRVFIKVFVNSNGTAFVRDAAQPIKVFTR